MESRQVWPTNREQQGGGKVATVPPAPGNQVPHPRETPGVPAYHDPALAPGAPSSWGLQEWAFVIAIAIGAAAAMVTIPVWLPILGASIIGADVKVYWYLSRASGLTAFVLLSVSMASGLIITNKM